MKHQTIPILVAILLGICTGCGRDNEQPPPPSSPPESQAANKSAAAPAQHPVVTQEIATVEADLTRTVTAEDLEVEYLQADTLRDKIALLDDISDTDSAGAVGVLGRLFYLEPDIELKKEVLNAMVYIDDQDDAKLQLFTEAIQPDQPKSVRFEAIDLMVEEGNPHAINALQPLVVDADPEIRDEAVYAIEELQGGE